MSKLGKLLSYLIFVCGSSAVFGTVSALMPGGQVITLPVLTFSATQCTAMAASCTVTVGLGAETIAMLQNDLNKGKSQNYSESRGNGNGGQIAGIQDKPLSQGEIALLKKKGLDIHDLKPKKNGSQYDLYKDKNGDIYYKRKNGYNNTEPEYIDLNINNF